MGILAYFEIVTKHDFLRVSVLSHGTLLESEQITRSVH